MNPAGLSATLHKVWLPVEGVTVRNRAGTAVVGGTLRWDPYGFGNRNVTLSVCSGGHNWSVVVNRLGQAQTGKAVGCVSLISVVPYVNQWKRAPRGDSGGRNTLPFAPWLSLRHTR